MHRHPVRSARPRTMTALKLRKTSEVLTSTGSRLLYVMSDATQDRYGDVIEAEGWDLTEFVKNPVALANHDPHFVVGRWEGVHITSGQLRGHLVLAPEGTSER